ncbi:MAG: phosphatase PAP2 family protein [Chloroflexota bacterium]
MVDRKAKPGGHGAAGVVLAALALGAFALLYRAVRSGRSARLDHRATIAIQRRDHPVFDALMNLVSWPGFPPQSRIIPALLAVAWLIAGKPLEALFQLLGWGTGLLSFLVKRSMRRPRPSHPEIRVREARIGGTSFPSGHVIIYTGVYGTLARLLTWDQPVTVPRRLAALLLWTLVALVGPSRMYLGHHFLTDITASYLLGGTWVFLLMRAYGAARRRLASRFS